MSRYFLKKAKQDIFAAANDGLFGDAEMQKFLESEMKLADIRFQTRTYERAIPIVFGEVLLAGNIIWTSDLRSQIVNQEQSRGINLFGFASSLFDYTSSGGTSAEELGFAYYIDVAFAICEGKVDDLLGVLINGELVDTDDFKFRFYNGSESQEPDVLLIKEYGELAPAFRGLCYAVFENLEITKYGRILPKIEFFIRRTNFAKAGSLTSKVKNLLKGVNLMPGSGEFVYDTAVNAVYGGVFLNESNLVDGEITHSNMNNNKKKPDSLVALDLMKEDLPEVKWVSLVVTWFCDGLDISKISIFPAVEFNDGKSASYPTQWNVAGKTRWQARQVSRRSDGSLNYGGTVCDSSVISILKELKRRGYKIAFYPMIFVDNESKPWRGRITGDANFVESFFEKKEGYNNFILHYARLVKGLCDVFIVGSEMKGLTSVKDVNGNFPAVKKFAKLAKMVKEIEPNFKVTYAADWSEYHSINGFYNMDELWSSEFIDFIGIDAYFPLTYTKRRPSVQEIKEAWQSGEGYDFYFAGEEKIFYEKPDFAWKNLRWFVSNPHTNVDGSQTNFKPFSKKIWFTEFGFPSVDLCTNQPNVFYDPSSVESFLPRFSEGIPDYSYQKEALLGSLQFIEENSDIIENAFVWCYDLRPYPFFPKRKDIWSDGDLWQKGHWLNGKMGANTVDEVLLELCVKSGILEEEVQFENCNGFVEGMCINKENGFDFYVKMLCDVYFLKMIPSEMGIKFKSLEYLNFEENEPDITANLLIKKSDLIEKEEENKFAPSAVQVSFIEKTGKYEPSNIYFNVYEQEFNVKEVEKFSFPIVFGRERMMHIAKNLLKMKINECFKRKVSLNFSSSNTKPGNVVILEDRRFFVENIGINEGLDLLIEAFEVPFFETMAFEESVESETLYQHFLKPEVSAFVMEYPRLVYEEDLKDERVFSVFASNLASPARLFLKLESGELKFVSSISKNCFRGKILLESSYNFNSDFPDYACYFEVFIYNYKNLQAIFSSENFENTAIFGGEICSFAKVVYKGDGIFSFSKFLRRRYKAVEGFEKDEFLLLSSGVNYFKLPSYIESGKLILQTEKKEIEMEFKANNLSIFSFEIASKNFRLLHEGILLFWAFKVNSDFRFFEREVFKEINVEISFPNGKKLETKGESYFLTFEKQLELFGEKITKLDFSVKII